MQGYAYLKKRIQGELVFLALDNVPDDYNSIQTARKYLKGGYGDGSIILVTARSLDILMKLNLEENQCLEMPDLEEDEARSIFFKETGLLFENEIDEKLIRRCIQLCHFCKADGRRWHYHPLALKVLGQQLGSNIQMWEVQLNKIDSINQLEDVEDAIFYIMRSSFASLNQKLQLIFMDLALILNYFALEKIEWLCIVHEESIEDMKDMVSICS